jgi:uncharacterized protein (DUF488 family)
VSALWTIGYERAALGEVIATLQAARIALVIDVRELPNSRRAGFSKRQLEAGLDEAGIAYRHLKPLGTPKAGRDASRRGDKATMRAIFEAKLATPESQLALAEAAALARAQRAYLLCLEHDWRGCHRAILCEALAPAFTAAHLEPAFAA